MQNAGGKDENLAHEGYLLLAERLRTEEERQVVWQEIEKITKIKISIDTYLEQTWESIKGIFSFSEKDLES